MPDTPENQAVYPQPSTQAPAVGFPLARLVMVICLATGAALDAAIGPHRGKGTGELGLVRGLLKGFHAGDVMLADALYCNYFLIAAMMAYSLSNSRFARTQECPSDRIDSMSRLWLSRTKPKAVRSNAARARAISHPSRAWPPA